MRRRREAGAEPVQVTPGEGWLVWFVMGDYAMDLD